jgi:hypothetical protein
MADASDTFWRWAPEDLADHAITMDAELHHSITSLPEADWHFRAKVNRAAGTSGCDAERRHRVLREKRARSRGTLIVGSCRLVSAKPTPPPYPWSSPRF